MSNKILKYVRTVVFIAMVAGLVKCMDYAMMPSGYIRYIIHETDNADTDDGYDKSGHHGNKHHSPDIF